MEAIKLGHAGDTLQVEGVPDGAKVISLSGPKARRLADLSLHKADLDFALACLDQINLMPENPPTTRHALWRSAIVHYMKCFGDAGVRFQIDAVLLYRDKPNAMVNFDFFKALRNRHVVHDENSYSQSIPGAILNDRSKAHKVEKIVCLTAVSETLTQDNFSNLHGLIEVARDWVTSRFDALCDLLTLELEAEPYDALVKREPMGFTPPQLAEIGVERRVP